MEDKQEKDRNRIEELERELSLYQNAVQGANVGIWEWNVRTGEQSVNSRWAEIVGYTLEELFPVSIATWKRLVHPKDLVVAENKLSDVFSKAERYYSLIFRMKHKDGHWIWIESNGAVNSWTPEGKPLLISGSHVDITKRKAAEDAVKDSERRLKATQEIAHIGNWEIDLETKEVWGSEEAFKIYGLERISEKIDLQVVQAMAKAEYRKSLDEALFNLITKNMEYKIEYKIMNGLTGRETVIHSMAKLQTDDRGKPVRVIITIRDMTEENKRREELVASNQQLKAAFLQLQAFEKEITAQNIMLNESKELIIKNEERNRAIVSVLPDIIFLFDGQGNFIDCQMNDSRNLLLPKEEFIRKNIYDIMPDHIAHRGMECIRETLKSGQLQKFEYLLAVGGENKYFETRMVKCCCTEVLAIVRDITFEKKEKEYIMELSLTDHLTGLYNRRYFEQRLEAMNTEANLPMMIIMIDVNGLKLTNDAFGHLMGDELLKTVAGKLREFCPDSGFVARVGGDEFAMVCPVCDEESAEKTVNRIYNDINKEKLNNIMISVSAGYAVRRTMETSITDTFTKAENYMVRKKLVESQSMRNQTIQAIMQTLNEKSEREKMHSVKVSEWSRKIGEAMSLNQQALKEIEMAGLLHDIGKIAVKEDILNKPGRLTKEEYSEIKRHSESGYQIVKSVDVYSPLAEYILAHHERYDGKGYPRGLRDEEIPLISRIISIADAFEAMIADRPYRKGMSLAGALNEVRRNSGTQFDPVIAAYFLELFP